MNAPDVSNFDMSTFAPNFSSARKANAELQEVDTTSASKLVGGGAPSHVKVAYRVASEIEVPDLLSSGVSVPAQYFEPRNSLVRLNFTG